MAATKVTTKVIADDAVTIDKINDSVLVTESEGISSNDNDTTVPTSAAVKDYVDTEVAGLVDAAPATLDTLNELAAALGDDHNFSTTVTNSIATKQDAATAVTTTTNFGGDVSGTYNNIVIADDSHNHTIANVDGLQTELNSKQDSSTALTTSTNFSGDVSGTYNAIVIADDSHNHTIANVDGLQTALDGKVDGTGTAGTLPKLSDSNTITDSAISESGEIIDIDTTGAIRVPDGTTAERPGTPVAGMFRYNTTDGQFEGYTTEWGAIAGTGAGGGGSVDVVTTQHTGDGSTQGFALDSTPGDNDAVQVYLNGVYQVKDAANYSISGSTLTFVTPPTNSTAIEFVHFKLTSGGGGGISWDTDVKIANFGATAGEGYFVDTTSAAITVTLPSSPSAGDEVSIVDYAGTADTNNITITSSDNINGAADDVLINYKRGGVSMVYVDATQGWIAYNAANETASALNIDAITVDYLVVAGGGGGAGSAGGGGGAGGLRTSYGSTTGGGGSAESSLTLSLSENFTVTVGTGGAGNNASGDGTNGYDSVFSTITSTGGGAGDYNNDSDGGSDGGSGGGADFFRTDGGSAVTSPVVQGYNGGNGGGGAGAAGALGSNPAGGIGLAVNILSSTNATTASVGQISGSDVYYAGGGGGGADGLNPAGGLGGGGAGGNGTSSNGTSGTANTGGGGGGAWNTSANMQGGSGGSGVVILRYSDDYTITETTSGGNVLTFNTYTEGSDKVTVFTAGTNGTIQFS